ncbi:terpene synthase isoform X1 [Helicoverpa armigera]|uniref:terpene synthase isoform X1 n=1 Tax=Helicoverpa armigera TaxID=29058 RepID=UPI001F5A744D|nr:terpene synthase isoform X1 [Helicoverpa armigera]XP_047022540.1 geranylgeranyl pyrophosphate synthase isoform X1 [Helicoverpa zea]
MSKVSTNTGDNTQDEKILMPYTYIQQVPGKQIRQKLASAFNYWLKISDEKLRAVGEIVQMLHNSSLLSKHRMPPAPQDTIEITYFNAIDDIQDNSILRRGIPVAHSIYGVASTINAANYTMIVALEKTQELGHPMATRVYTEQLLELHRGQGIEIYWRDNFQCPSEEEYKEMTIKKTGGLFMLAIRLMQLFSENKSDFSKLSAILGLYFQIRDDYCNLRLQEYTENKSYCEDLTEGKFSFPIIHAIRNPEGDKQVLHILRQRTRDLEVKRYCITILERIGSFAYTRETLQSLDEEARREVARLGGNPHLEALLDDLLSWRRDKPLENNV